MKLFHLGQTRSLILYHLRNSTCIINYSPQKGGFPWRSFFLIKQLLCLTNHPKTFNFVKLLKKLLNKHLLILQMRYAVLSMIIVDLHQMTELSNRLSFRTFLNSLGFPSSKLIVNQQVASDSSRKRATFLI